MSSRKRGHDERGLRSQRPARDADASAEVLPDDGGPLGDDAAARPLPLLGRTWLERGTAYRRRRRRSVALYAGCLAFAVLAAALFDFAFVSGASSTAAKVAVGVGYLVPAAPAYLFTRRHLARYGLESRRLGSGAPGLFGVVALVVTPIALGVGVAVMQGVLEPWFPGERAARQDVLRRRARRHPVLH